MIKIIAVSDNHGYIEPINKILSQNSNADFYLHMGDVCSEAQYIVPFVAVKGNNDIYDSFPEYKIIEVDKNNRIFMTHGHQFTFNKEKLIEKAKMNKCNIILCGHTHVFSDQEIDGIRIINPGSCVYNRNRSKPTYAEIDIDGGNIKVIKQELEQLF